jgi:hypothetical protein
MPTARTASLFIALLLITSSRAVRAQTISVNGNPGLLRVSSAVAGSEPTSVTDATPTFSIVTPNPGNNKYQILMSLNANMPAGVTLNATLGIPAASQATSNGPVALDVTPRALLINIKKGYTGTAATTYQLVATTAAGVVPLSNRTVTYTITLYP